MSRCFPADKCAMLESDTMTHGMQVLFDWQPYMLHTVSQSFGAWPDGVPRVSWCSRTMEMDSDGLMCLSESVVS